MSEKKPFYITTTLPYVNAEPHIGFAMELVHTDVIARAKKLQGYEVFFNTGTDEHGAKVYNKAKEANKDPQEFVNQTITTLKAEVSSLPEKEIKRMKLEFCQDVIEEQ